MRAIEPDVPCPDPDTLQRFLLGLSPDREVGLLEAHLADCPTCLAVVQTLNVSDAFLKAVSAGVPSDGADPAEGESLIARLKQRRPPVGMPYAATRVDGVPLASVPGYEVLSRLG